jgi:cupin fold WbuC family metalloprotein
MIESLTMIGDEVYRVESDTFVFSETLKEFLILKAHNSKRSRSRICLHPSPQAFTQEMIICLLADSHIPMHSHSAEACESYHILEGILYVEVSQESDSETHILDKGALYWQRGGVWHRPYSRNICIYHEVLYGAAREGQMILR